jgi:hypothetical protein
MTDTIYSGEAVLLGWGESSRDGAWVKFQISEDSLREFRGRKTGSEHGERFMVAVAGPLQNDETAIPSPQDKRGISAGGGVGRDGETRSSPATPTNSLPPVVGVEPGGDSVPVLAAPPVSKQRTASQRAALLLQSEGFDEFARAHTSFTLGHFGDVEHWLLKMCGVERKREIEEGNAVLPKIEGNFRAWKLARAHGQLER